MCIICKEAFEIMVNMERTLTYLLILIHALHKWGIEAEPGRGKRQIMQGLKYHFKEFENHFVIYAQTLMHFK